MPIDDATLATIRSGMAGLRVASAHDSVGNDECEYSFDSPFSSGGLYTNLKTFRGVGKAWLDVDVGRSGGCVLYAHQKWRRVPLDVEETEKEASVLGVGVDGGFSQEDDRYETVKERSLCVYAAGTATKVDLSEVPEFVSMIAQSIFDHAGSGSAKSSVAQWALDDGPPPTSKYAEDLIQIPNPPKLSADPRSWRCEYSGDTENLWLNLSDGYVGGGRDQSAWGGPKGSNGALKHFEETGYPLVVKLGTISVAGAEVYSYAKDEDGRVEDPHLSKHLAHFGIDPRGMAKTEKTTSELEVDANAKFEWSAIAEAGEKLVPVSEAGKIGLVNLGNSCYMNSVVQLLSSILGSRYNHTTAPRLVDKEVLMQFAKLFSALQSDDYAKPARALAKTAAKLNHAENGDDDSKTVVSSADDALLSEEDATADKAATVAPRAFKRIVAGNHVEFSTGRQQDAAEYLLWLVEVLQRAEHPVLGNDDDGDGGPLGGNKPTSALFQFGVEERTECLASHAARYKTSSSLCLDLPVPKDKIKVLSRTEEEPDAKRTKTDDAAGSTVVSELDFEPCLEAWAADGVVEDFYSSATKRRGAASRRLRIKTFPPYLIVKMSRYYVDFDTWEPKKLSVEILVPEKLDLSSLRAPPRLPDEPLLPEDDDAAASSSQQLVPDETILAQLVSMGFDENGCRRACLATQNAGAEAAMEWVFAHSGDADFAAPIVEQQAEQGKSATATTVDETAVAELASLGFTSTQAEAALKACDGNKERAADWIFSHLDNLDAACQAVLDQSAAPSQPAGDHDADFEDGPPTYELEGFISHIGKNTSAGHYVAHVKKSDGSFYIFDDEKVAKSLKPPFKLGYLYLYKRSDVDSKGGE